MKIILTEDIKNLGYKDDVVEVKAGYGRNYLIPQGKAKLATEGAMKMLAEDIRQREFKLDKIRKDAEAVAAKLNGVSLTLAAKTGASGKIFGSITALQVANMLKDQGYEVDRRKIMLDDVKTLGSYEATVNLFKDIRATVKVEVVAE
ncbi:MAG: 50S ribosomal protein L9 [Bacteroidetes bacterium]|nr:50S ribosomal protein L9 [Bacteroidota bacterium]MDA0943270.1 50S ribosomal protein L9 [Bacteroidota bacterium]MDA1111141.1 50S ribosomal protein L9 [Bacteroidota bacterium]